MVELNEKGQNRLKLKPIHFKRFNCTSLMIEMKIFNCTDIVRNLLLWYAESFVVCLHSHRFWPKNTHSTNHHSQYYKNGPSPFKIDLFHVSY
jgi:hypothetical protein